MANSPQQLHVRHRTETKGTIMKNTLLAILGFLVLTLPVELKAQFSYITNRGTITITGYSIGAGLNPVIPASINGYPVTSIGDKAFYNQTTILSVTIPDSVSYIGNDAFYYCLDLTNVTIPNSVTGIGISAFARCYGLTSMMIPNSVTSIGGSAFADCSGLTNVTIPDSVTSIGNSVFYSCSDLTSVTIPNSVTSIGDEAFVFCSGLTTVTIGNSVTSIGNDAFADCSSLTNVTIPNSVTSIGNSAFSACYGLPSVTIPYSVTDIGIYAFYYCTNLHQVYFEGNAPNVGSGVFDYTSNTVYYLPGTTGWGPLFDGRPTAPWFLPNPLILNQSVSFGVQPGGFGFTISWATNASVVVEAATNLANPVWIPVSTNTLTGGTNYFSDPQWTNFPSRFYRVQLSPAYTVSGTLTGLPAGDTVTIQNNGSDNLTLSANGPFTFPTALPNGHAYSITVSGIYFGGLTPTTCTFTNGSGTISGDNVTNVAAQCAWTGTRPPALTGNPDVDMFNAAVADGTANGGVPGVMYTEHGGPFRVTAPGVNSSNVSLRYQGWSTTATTIGNTSCSSTTFPSGTAVIQFGTALVCGFGPYGY